MAEKGRQTQPTSVDLATARDVKLVYLQSLEAIKFWKVGRMPSAGETGFVLYNPHSQQ